MANLGFSPWLLNAIPLVMVFFINYKLLNDVEPTSFQRFGAVWICFAVIIISYFVRNAGNQLERLANLKRRMSASNQRLMQISQHPGVGSSEVQDIESEQKDLTHKIEGLESSFSRSVKSLTFYEALTICLGTLQTSYGDLFHCWYNDKGWTTC